MMKNRTFEDDNGDVHDERRKSPPQAHLPPWVDYSVIAGVVGLVFWGGIQANRLDTISHQLESLQNQMTVLQASNPKADVAVLQEKSHQADQAIADLKDTILRRLDRLDVKIDEKNRGLR